MDLTDRVVIQLLAIGLDHEAAFDVSFEEVDWPAVIQSTMEHGLDAVAFDGVQALYDRRPDLVTALDTSLGEQKYEWVGFALQAEQDYAAYRSTLRNLVSFYNEEKIPVLLLKGYGLSLNYPVPQHRPCGDIDIYLFGDWDRADRAVSERFGVQIDKSHHHHTVFSFEGRSVENHYDILNVYAHRSSRRLESILKAKAQEDVTEHTIDGSRVLLPGADFNALFLLRHNASHFASVDMNLRQVLDWSLFVEKNHDEIDWPWLYGVLRRENMVRFANSLNSIGVEYLGFDRSLFPEVEKDKALVRRILNEIMHPFFQQKEDGTLLNSLRVKTVRWWQNRWKHRLCYADSLISSFFNSLYAKILKPSHFIH